MPVEKVKGGFRWGKNGKVYKRRIDAVKEGEKNKAQGINKFNKGGIPTGYHKMPDGTIMKNSEHKDYRHGGLTIHLVDNRKKK